MCPALSYWEVARQQNLLARPEWSTARLGMVLSPSELILSSGGTVAELYYPVGLAVRLQKDNLLRDPGARLPPQT